ncbi:unnamed protein product, partial [marine sediment metagenome]
MKEKVNRFGRRLEHLLSTEDQAAIGIIAAVIIMVVAIGLIMVIVANIVPLIIFLVLAIVFALIVKHFIFGGRSLGVTKGVAGITREVGREFVPVAKQAGGML